MSRRAGNEEMQFGSDSFLDVLANMVGILIILIVIAGARVGRSPVPRLRELEEQRRTSAETGPIETAPAATSPEDSTVPQPLAALPAGPALVAPETPSESTSPSVASTAIVPDWEPDAAEIARRDSLNAELQALQDQARREEISLARTTLQEDNLQRQLSAEQRALAQQAQELQKAKLGVMEFEAAVHHQKSTLQGLLAEFEQVSHSKPPSRELKHRLTPISQSIVGEEIHFRLAGNRVSYIPLNALVDRLKSQVDRQKEWLVKFRSHQGTVGPIGGFSMNYLVERHSLSVLDEARHGPGTFRIAVSMWQLVPEQDLEGETATEALRPTSKFALALQSAPPKSAVTMWVYPDSYALYRKLQSAAHAEGFVVSARPLPEGMPIAGSPHGTRSAGQ